MKYPWLSFQLDQKFVEGYADQEEPFGFEGLGKTAYLRTYSREKPDGSKEEWYETCERVINGMYSILQDYCLKNNRKYDPEKAHKGAQEAFDRLFRLKWSPPGRGLWMCGTRFVHERRVPEALQNCAFISTRSMANPNDDSFEWSMRQLMLGVGVGFDTKGSETDHIIKGPSKKEDVTYKIQDTRESWAHSVQELILSYLHGLPKIQMDYSSVRPEGEKIQGFGGTASGPRPLKKLHDSITRILKSNIGQPITSRIIVDIQNMIGQCVVAGNVRRSAEIALGEPNDTEFLDLKNYTKNPDRAEYGWSSNNSIYAKIGQDYSEISQRIANNGEPGVVWMENVHRYGRMGDSSTPDKAEGFNPCAEQPLESKEMCTLVELYPTRNTDLYDLCRSLKFAYLYGKAVSLLSEEVSDKKSRGVMMRNRRIGLSMTGISQFVESQGANALRVMCQYAYQEVERYDRTYSMWLGISRSVRKTTVKPSGTISLLAGVTPGVHYPESQYYIRRITLASNSPMLKSLSDAGYKTEPANNKDGSHVVEFPINSGVSRTLKEVTIWEQLEIAAIMQQYWSDNGVSITVSFDPENTTEKEIEKALDLYQFRLKAVSMLPRIKHGAYPQMPYEEISKEEYIVRSSKIKLDVAISNDSNNKMIDRFCDGEACEIPSQNSPAADD